jgi:hypothetical protein
MSFNPFVYYGYLTKPIYGLLFDRRTIISDKVEEDVIQDWIALNPLVLTLIKKFDLEL